MTSHNDLPDWHKHWKLDDPDWVKQRAKDWRRLSKKLDRKIFYRLKAAHLKVLKNFFLYGQGDFPKCNNPEKPLYGVSEKTLFECWLSADQSERAWQRIKENKVTGRLQ